MSPLDESQVLRSGASASGFADFNGAGKNNIAAAVRAPGKVVWYPNNGSRERQFGQQQIIDNPVKSWQSSLKIADVNLDESPEILTFGRIGGDLLLHQGNQQTASFSDALMIDESPNFGLDFIAKEIQAGIWTCCVMINLNKFNMDIWMY